MPQTRQMENLFGEIAPRYDLLNHLLSLNIDRGWRRKLVKKAALQPGSKVLDLCTGTGDIALEFARTYPEASITGFDLTQEMLEIAKLKTEKEKKTHQIQYLQGNALELPFEDESFDVISIGFGLRNLPDPQKGIQEMSRVLKKGGRLFILEFSPEQKGFFGYLYRFQLKYLVPFFGRLISGSKNAYEYLSASIPDFLKPSQVLGIMKEKGFSKPGADPLIGKIAYIYEGTK